jgi:hypothetical protein
MQHRETASRRGNLINYFLRQLREIHMHYQKIVFKTTNKHLSIKTARIFS